MAPILGGGDGTVLGVDFNADVDNLKAFFQRIDPEVERNLTQKNSAANMTQLQPAGNIRLAGGKEKKRTEQFPVVAGGDGKLPKANRATNGFNLNRQAIARNRKVSNFILV